MMCSPQVITTDSDMRLLVFLLTIMCSTAFAQPDKSFTSTLQAIDDLLSDSKYDEVIKVADQFAGTAAQKLTIDNKKSEALIRLVRFEEADNQLARLLEQANKLNRADLKAITQTNIGLLRLNQGRVDLAEEELHIAIKNFDDANQSRSLAMADALAHLGNVYRTAGKNAQAEEQLLHSLAIRQENLPTDHELIAASYNDLGLIYTQLNVDKSYEYYDMALAMYEKLHGKDHPKIAIANTNLGIISQADKQYGDAITYYNTALTIWEKIYPQPHPNKAYVMMNLGQTYSTMGNSITAMEFYDKALAIYKTTRGTKHPDVTYILNLIGNESLAQKKYDEALASYQKALIANLPSFNNESIEINPTEFNYYNGTQLLYSLMYKAQGLEARHLGKTLKLTDLQLAISTLQSCDSLIDKMRQQTTYESDKISLGVVANEIYADGVRISHMLSDVSIIHRDMYRELCFYFAEKSKAAVLQDAISDTNAKSYANIPADLLEEEKSLKAARALVTQKLAQKPTADEEKYLRETAFQLNQAYLEFTRQLEQKYPDYYNLKFNSTTPSILQLQKFIDENTTVLSYFIDEKSGRLYTYLISSKQFVVKDQSLPETYDKLLNGYRNSMYFSSENSFISTSRSLYRLLIPKGIASGTTSLVILPTGRMSVIPFEALLTKAVKNLHTPFSQLPYLVNDFNVRYEFSAGLLIQKGSVQNNALITSARLLAPVNFPESNNLSPLPGTKQEVDEISKLLAGQNITCDVLLNSNANEAAIKSEDLNKYSLIHLATHGIVDEDNPELSRIFLQTDSEAEDGNLFSGEIYNLHLNANLVTLSACQTGLGKISKGEGVIGLSRALVYAGAKNLIVSFWSVADQSTAELMTNFYQNLLQSKNQTFNTGLRDAKLKMIKNETYASPYYWAPFVLIGY